MNTETYEINDVLYASWGYDQTNVDYYQVVDKRKVMIKLRPIASKTVRAERGADYVVADPNNFRTWDVLLDNGNNSGGGDGAWKRPGKYGVHLKHTKARKCDPHKERYETAAGYGH